jgi:hypothetical protein
VKVTYLNSYRNTDSLQLLELSRIQVRQLTLK